MEGRGGVTDVHWGSVCGALAEGERGGGAELERWVDLGGCGGKGVAEV